MISCNNSDSSWNYYHRTSHLLCMVVNLSRHNALHTFVFRSANPFMSLSVIHVSFRHYLTIMPQTKLPVLCYHPQGRTFTFENPNTSNLTTCYYLLGIIVHDFNMLDFASILLANMQLPVAHKKLPKFEEFYIHFFMEAYRISLYPLLNITYII